MGFNSLKPARRSIQPGFLIILFLLPPLLLTLFFLLDVSNNSRTLRIGYSLEAPYAFINPEGRVTGEAPEIARLVAQQLGYSIQWRQYDFSSLIPALILGQIDVIASGMFITPEREQQILFSLPTSSASAGILVRQSADSPSSFAQLLESRDINLAVLAGSVEIQTLVDSLFPEERLIQVLDAKAGAQLVEMGQVNGLLLSYPTVQWLSQANPENILFAFPFPDGPEPGYGAFGFSKTNRKLRDQWNQVLDEFLGTDEHKSLVNPFGFTGQRPMRTEGL